MRPSAQPAPAQFIRRQLEQTRGPLIKMDDLEIGGLAVSVADRRQRQDAVVGGVEDRVEQIVLGAAFIDVDAGHSAAPARGHRKRENVVNLDKAVADAMGRRQMRLAAPPCIRHRFAQDQRAVGRKRIERRIPHLGFKPLFDVASSARNLELRSLVLDEHDMIGQAAKAAEHHVFKERQIFFGLEGCMPLAAQYRNVAEQFRI